MPRISKDGRVTIPKDIREILGIHPRDEVIFENKNGVVKILKKDFNSLLDKYTGYLGKGKTNKIITDMRGETCQID